MDDSIKEKVEKLGMQLPNLTKTGGNYNSIQIRGNIGYIAIQFPILNGVSHYQGKLGKDLSTQDGYLAMRLCALNVLSQINEYISYDKLEGLNHVIAYYQGIDSWDESPRVVDGASDLLNEILKEKGYHSRSLIGVCSLPKGFSVGLTVSFSIIG